MSDGARAIALEQWTNFIEACPDDPAGWYERGGLWLDMGNFEQAFEDYSEGLRCDPEFADCRYCRALALEGLGRDDDALQEYSTVIEVSPNFTSAYNNRGRIYMRKGLHREALADFRAASELDPRHPKSRFNQGMMLATLQRYEEAISALTKAIDLKPDYLRAYVMRAKTYAFTDRLEQAADDLNASAELGRDNAEWHAIWAWLFMKSGQPDEFKEALTQAIRIDPACEELTLIQAALQRSPDASPSPLPTSETLSLINYRREEEYREDLRPGESSEGVKRLRRILTEFLLVEDATGLAEAVARVPVMLREDVLKFFELLIESPVNMPIRKKARQNLSMLRFLASRTEGLI